MNKIICEFCGTSYPEAEAQCPICGCVRPVEDDAVLNIAEATDEPREYHYVKGGRFSKSNVRKRTAVHKVDYPDETEGEEEIPEKEQSNKGLVITILILLLAIAAVIVYIALTFFKPENDIRDQIDQIIPSQTITEPTQDLSCKEIRLETSEIVLEEVGATVQLMPTLIPANTEDTCVYATSNDAVATVTADGLITAIGSGEAVVTISCGDISAQCSVVVLEPTIPFVLAYEEITFTAEGEFCQLYEGELNPDEIVWATEDESVALVSGGNVVAAGNGVTTIYASYNGETVTCVVYCDFQSETETPTEPFVDKGPYQLKNAFGFSNSDVTIRIGETFTLILIDKYGDKVDNVTWSVKDGDSCTVDNGAVTGVSSGKATVVATLNGKEYTCLVRVS